MEVFGAQTALALRRFLAYGTATGALIGLISSFKSGIAQAISFDREMVRLTQVSGKSGFELERLSGRVTELSTSLGVSSKELIDVSSTLAQAGLTINQTKTVLEALAKSALAPSFDNLKETTEGVIAAMRQFSLEATDVDKALGSINAVAAAYAVESRDLVTAIRTAGGVFASSSKGVAEGTNALNQFLAVFTSVRQTTRADAAGIATGLNTIFARIQRPRTIEYLKELGINLQDLTGKFVGPYEAIKRLSAGIQGLDTRSTTFSGLVEELGGYRQIRNVVPLLQQAKVATEAYGVAQKGADSLARDSETAQASLAVQIAKTREEFLALVRHISESKGFHDLATFTLSIANGFIRMGEAIKPILPYLTVLAGIKLSSGILQFASGFGSRITGNGFQANRLGFAQGGLVPGEGNSDSVVAPLAPGSFVIRKNAVRALGGYAKGGEVLAALTPGEVVIPPETATKIGASKLQKLNHADIEGYAKGGALRRVSEGSYHNRDIIKHLYNKNAGGGLIKGYAAGDFTHGDLLNYIQERIPDFTAGDLKSLKEDNQDTHQYQKVIRNLQRARFKPPSTLFAHPNLNQNTPSIGDIESTSSLRSGVSPSNPYINHPKFTPVSNYTTSQTLPFNTQFSSFPKPAGITGGQSFPGNFSVPLPGQSSNIGVSPSSVVGSSVSTSLTGASLPAVGGGLNRLRGVGGLVAFTAASQLPGLIGNATPNKAAISGGLQGALAGGATGAFVGSALGPVGTAVGGIGGAAIGAITGALNAFKEAKIRESLEALTKSNDKLEEAFSGFEKGSVGGSTLGGTIGVGLSNVASKGTKYTFDENGIAIGDKDIEKKALEERQPYAAASQAYFKKRFESGNFAAPTDDEEQQTLRGLAYTGKNAQKNAGLVAGVANDRAAGFELKEGKSAFDDLVKAAKPAYDAQQKLSNQLKETTNETEILAQTFGKISAVIQRVEADSQRFDLRSSNITNAAGGHNVIGGLQSKADVFSNVHAYTTSEVSNAFDKQGQDLGISAGVTNKFKNVSLSSKVLSEELPKYLLEEQGRSGKSPGTQLSELTPSAIKEVLGRGGLSPESFPEEFRSKFLDELQGEQGTTQRGGNNSSEQTIRDKISKSIDSLDKIVLKAAFDLQKGLETANKKYLDGVNHYIQLQSAADEARSQAVSKSESAENQKQTIRGRTLSLSAIARPEENQLRSLAGTSNVDQIISRSQAARSRIAEINESLATGKERVVDTSAQQAGFGVASTQYKSVDLTQKRIEELGKEMEKLGPEANNLQAALKLAATASGRLAGIQEKLAQEEAKGKAGQNLVDQLVNESPLDRVRARQNQSQLQRLNSGQFLSQRQAQQAIQARDRQLAQTVDPEQQRQIRADFQKRILTQTNVGRGLLNPLEAGNAALGADVTGGAKARELQGQYDQAFGYSNESHKCLSGGYERKFRFLKRK